MKFKYTKQNLLNILKGNVDNIDAIKQTYHMSDSKKSDRSQGTEVITKDGHFIVKDGQLVPYTPKTREQRGLPPTGCSVCNRMFRKEHDLKFWYTNGMCQQCTMQFQSQLIISGLWQDYCQYKQLDKFIGQNKEALNKLLQQRNSLVQHQGTFSQVVGATGHIETFTVDNWQQLAQQMKNDIEVLQRTIEKNMQYIQTLVFNASKLQQMRKQFKQNKKRRIENENAKVE